MKLNIAHWVKVLLIAYCIAHGFVADNTAIFTTNENLKIM